MSDILYSKLRLSVPEQLDGEDVTITSENGNTRTVEMSSPVTDIILPGMEKYNIQGGLTDEDLAFGYGEIKKLNIEFDIYNYVKSNDNIPELYWLAFLNANGISQVITKGEQATFRGKTVVLSNTVVPNYTNWIIADFNHDSTSNTCDVIQANTIYNTAFGSNQTYNGSTVRSWLIDTYYPGFNTDIKNKLQTMSVASNGSTLSDKIKLLSVTEVGGSHNYAPVEGTKYPIFTSSSGIAADSSRVKSGTNSSWWLRTRTTNNTNIVWIVYSDGSLNYYYYTDSSGVVPCLRFA